MWTEVEHTADIGINVKGDTLESFFAYATLGLAQFLGARYNQFTGEEPRNTYNYHRFADTPEGALVKFLQEILFLKETQNFNLVWPDICVPTWRRSGDKGTFEVFARLHGYMGDTEAEDIKAVTYHNLEILEGGEAAYEATIIFDV
jgi:SHS2 domain-containing protein